MANIFDLTVYAFLNILRFLDTQDKIAFAFTCERFRNICMDGRVFRKLDLSRCRISTTQRGEINKFFRDRHLRQHIRELNVSDFHVLNWQMNDQLEEFISMCLHLEALHVLSCGMSLQRLLRILKQAPKLTALSWSLWDITSEDIQSLSKSMKSCDEISLKNIKNLHLEILRSKLHIHIAKYLLLSSCRDLEELEIYTWGIDKAYCTRWSFPHLLDDFIPGFPQPSVKNELQHLHSLIVVPVGCPPFVHYGKVCRAELSDLVLSVLSRKSSSTKWKKLWILPSIEISTRHMTDLSLLLHEDDFQSVEAIAVDADSSLDAADDPKTFFERIGDNTVRSLHLCLPSFKNSIAEFCDPIVRICGHSLKFLLVSVEIQNRIPAEHNIFIHTLFSNCSKITELDLLCCCFEKNISKSLSELKNLSKVQLRECAISSKSNRNQDEISKANLLIFVEGCKNITHLDVRCCGFHRHFSYCFTGNDLLALAMLRNLKSLTLYDVCGSTEWEFLQNISEHCKFLTTLRISARYCLKNSHIPILMESVKFLHHLAIDVDVPIMGSEVFWNLLSHARNLQRLCITTLYEESLNIPVAVEMLKSLPQLHVLHLHSYFKENVDDFYDQMIRMLEEKESDCRFSFEIVTGHRMNMSAYRKGTWINCQTGYSLISNKALPLNLVELCDMTPVLDIARF